MPALLEANRLTKTYGPTVALHDASFVIEPGVTGLLGANGDGKSTSLKLFLGLIDPDGGQALFDGVEVLHHPELRERIGYMPEHDCLPETMTGAEFLTYMAQVSGLPAHEARVRTADILRHVGLEEARYRDIGTYSTGMKQRVKLAQALVHDPVLALLDEPTAGLDPLGRQEMLELVKLTGHQFGISIVLSSHLMGDVEQVCDRVVVLDGGQLLREGSVEEFTQETERLAVTVTEGEDAFLVALRARGLDATVDAVDERTLLVDGVEDGDYDRIRDAVVESGALLYAMAPRQHSLTELFSDGQSDGQSDGLSDGASGGESSDQPTTGEAVS
jgi:ABC-2 type transport system ATP-binding protein